MEDDYIIDLATKISACNEATHSEVIADLSKYVQSLDSNDDIQNATNTIWRKNLLPIMLLEMKKDFSDFQPNSWHDGVSLMRAVHEVLIQVVAGNQSDETALQTRFYPDFTENLLCFYRQMQDNFNRSLEPAYRGFLDSKELLKQMKIVLELSDSFVSKFPDFAVRLVESPWFLQVFIADNEAACVLSADWLTGLVKMRPDLVGQAGKIVIKGIGNVMATVIDEIVYHLAVSTDERLVDADIRCLLALLEAEKTLISTLNHRYRGLKLILRKWCTLPTNSLLKPSVSKSFPANLNKLMRAIDIGTSDLSQAQWAVVKIQAWWKGISLRRRLVRTNRAFANFQVRYRARKTKQRKSEEIDRIRKELQFQISSIRQKKFREKLAQEVILMEALPAPIVLRHLERTRQEAAALIQARWRGCRERARLSARREAHKRSVAAISIQRHFRAFLSRRDLADRHDRLEDGVRASLHGVAGLTVERRSEISREAARWLQTHRHRYRDLPEEDQRRLYAEGARLRLAHLRGLQADRRSDLRRAATVANIEADLALLLAAPTDLRDPPPIDIDRYQCRVRPIANLASQRHGREIGRAGTAWWRLLAMEAGEDDLGDDDDLLADGGDDLDRFVMFCQP